MDEIVRVWKAIEGLGWTVEFEDLRARFGLAEEWTNGGTIRARRKIFLDSRRPMSFRKMLLVLLHEGGHALAHERGFRGRPHLQNEARAYLYGWTLARRLGTGITRAQWLEFNWEVDEWLRGQKSTPL